MNIHLLAIDQGTTGTTVLVLKFMANRFDVIAKGYQEFPQHFPRPAWVEHNLDEIWFSVESAVSAALKHADIDLSSIKAIGITNQRETTGLWYTDGRPAAPAIVWQDRRTAAHCDALKEKGLEAQFREKTGLVCDPYFSGTKIAYLLNEGGLRADAGKLKFGTMDTFLVYRLSGGAHVTDATNASRTLLYDIHKGAWSEELASVLGDIPLSLLPEVRPCAGTFAKTSGLSFLPDGIPISGIAGDQQAALFGQACFEVGAAKCTYGTGAFALMNTGTVCKNSAHGLLSTVAWQLGDTVNYALEGSVFVAGAMIQWLRDQMGFFSSSAEVEALAASVSGSEGVVVVPALTGLGAPHWRPDARGSISGLTRGVGRAHIARAALEGIALSVYDLLGAMEKDSGQPLVELKVDGGAAANDLLMQFQAEILKTPIRRPKMLESTAFGAAALAGLGIGLFDDVEEVSRAWQEDRSFSPGAPEGTYDEHIKRWREAIVRA